MHVYIVATSIVFGLAIVCLITVLAMLSDAQFRTWKLSIPAVACATLLGIAVSMVKNYDSVAVKRADEFFSTRSSAYSCTRAMPCTRYQGMVSGSMARASW